MDKILYVEMGGLFKMDEFKVISLAELKNQGSEIIGLSPSTGINKIGVRVRRLSILGLCSHGKIPNQLIGAAKKLFDSKDTGAIELNEQGELLDIIAKEVLIEPTFEDFEELAPLTDEQKWELYIYSQRGVEGLEKFRDVIANSDSDKPSEQVQGETESDTGDKE
mgnify:FL=1|jgi:hypothetical protein